MKPYYEHSGVSLYMGDCVDVLPQYEAQADLILTSPPYDNLRDYGGHGFDFDKVADACVGALAEGGVLVWVVAGNYRRLRNGRVVPASPWLHGAWAEIARHHDLRKNGSGLPLMIGIRAIFSNGA